MGSKFTPRQLFLPPTSKRAAEIIDFVDAMHSVPVPRLAVSLRSEGNAVLVGKFCIFTT